MTNDERDTQIAGALRRLRDATEVPPLDPRREQAVLAAFDAHWAHRTHRPQGARPRQNRGRTVLTLATAASIAFAITLDWLVVKHASRRSDAPNPVVDVAEFVRWPGADGLPPFESGELLRVDLPVSALPALGLWPPASAATVVQADIVVGQDGFARAVRIAQ